MKRSSRVVRTAAVVALAAALSGPQATRAQSGDPTPAGSPLGVAFAVLCGVGINITRHVGPIPIVVSVTAASCVGMCIDALGSPDP